MSGIHFLLFFFCSVPKKEYRYTELWLKEYISVENVQLQNRETQEDNINKDLGEIGCKDRRRMELAQDRVLFGTGGVESSKSAVTMI
jgi:hypothetical protein